MVVGILVLMGTHHELIALREQFGTTWAWWWQFIGFCFGVAYVCFAMRERKHSAAVGQQSTKESK